MPNGNRVAPTSSVPTGNQPAPIPDLATFQSKPSPAPATAPLPGQVSSAQPAPIGAQAPNSGTSGPGNVYVLKGGVTEEQALNATLLTGPRAASIKSALGVAQAGIRQAWVLPNPALEFDNGFAEFSYRFGVAVPIEPPWKLFLRLNAAKQNIGTAQLQLGAALWQLRADTRRAYTELVIAEEAAVMMRDLANLTRSLADVAQKRFSSGDVAKLDTYKAELAFQQADVDASSGGASCHSSARAAQYHYGEE